MSHQFTHPKVTEIRRVSLEIADRREVGEPVAHTVAGRPERAREHPVARALGLSIAVRWSPQDNVGEDMDSLSRRSLLGAGVETPVGLAATTAPAAAREIDPELVSPMLGQHDAMFGPHDVLDSVRPEVDLIAQHRQIARGVRCALRPGSARV